MPKPPVYNHEKAPGNWHRYGAPKARQMDMQDFKTPHNQWGQGMPPEVAESLQWRRPPIRSSQFEDFEKCPRKHLYRNRLGLRRPGVSVPLDLGTVYHYMLQQLYLGATMDHARKMTWGLVASMKSDLHALALEDGRLPGGAAVADCIEDLNLLAPTGMAMAEIFWEAVVVDGGPPSVVETPDGDPLVELILEAQVPRVSMPVRCPIDLVVADPRNPEQVYVVDHKTTSRDPMVRAMSTRLSGQAKLYRIVLQANLDYWHQCLPDKYPQLEVVGTIHNIIKKPTIKYCPNTKDKGGYQDYVNRVREWYENQRDSGKTVMLSSKVRFTEQGLTKDFLLRLQQQAAANYAKPHLDRFYQTGGYACEEFNRTCPYMELCMAPTWTWKSVIESGYIVQFREDEDSKVYRYQPPALDPDEDLETEEEINDEVS